ncbi:MAG: hypothetical protein WCJ99_10100 [Betaproteobacteria bacterium]
MTQLGDDLGDVNAMDTPLSVGAVKAWGLLKAWSPSSWVYDVKVCESKVDSFLPPLLGTFTHF